MAAAAPEEDGKARMIAYLSASPFNKVLGITLETLHKAEGKAVFQLPFSQTLERIAGTGQIHGGPLAALVDTAAAVLLSAVQDSPAATVNFRVDYLRPAANSSLRALAAVRRAGRRFCIVDVDVVDDSGNLVAVGRGTFCT